MEDYRRGAHTVYRLHYHFVFCTKYRKPVLRGDVGVRLRDLVRQVCQAYDVEIVRGHIRPDHVHLMLSVPPKVAPSKLMQAIKGRGAHHLRREFRSVRRASWGRHLFARGYFVCTTGNVTDAAIKAYIENQDAEPQDPTFKVSE